MKRWIIGLALALTLLVPSVGTHAQWVSPNVDHWSFDGTRCAYGRLYYHYVGHTWDHRQVYGQYLNSWVGYC